MKLTVDLWDVGQGNSTVVTLPDSSLVLIDVGPRNSPIVEWLKRSPKIIHSIVITHNDSDHIGGLPSIVGDASQEIRTVYLIRDPKSEKPSQTFCRLIRSLEERKRLGKTKVYTLTCGISVWQDGKCSLRVRFPDYLANIKATDPNQTSGILTLEDERQVFLIWGGDAALADIDHVCENTNAHFLDGPHHGAPQDKGLRTTEFKRLLGSIGSKRLHISVGTNNTYSHPNRDYLVAASTRGLKVTCTELTTRCIAVVPRRPIFSANALLGLSTLRQQSGHRREKRMKKRTAAALLGMVLCLSTGVFARDIKSSNSNPHPGWIRYETNMLAFYYAPDSIFTKDKSISEFAGKYAAAYENIISGLCLEKRPPIKVFVYDDDESAIKLIGRRAGKAEPNLGLIHARLDSTTGHEMCHIIADTLNNGVRPPRNMMDEGLATCFDFTTRDRFAEGVELLEKGKLVSSTDMAAAERSDQLDYAASGAYVGYLIAAYGIDKFKTLWCADKRAYDDQLKRIYGKSQEQAEQDWRAFLKAYKSAEESEFKIPANRPEGASLGQLEKGDCLLIRFRWGEWSSEPDKPMVNPDISPAAMPIKVCGTGKQAIQIPRATRSVPFLLPIQDSAEYSIRASDALNTYKDNNGFVLLKVRVLKNFAQKEDVAAAQNRVQTNTYARPMLRSLTEDNRTTRLPVPVTRNNTNDTATQESMQKLSDLCTKREKQDSARYTPAEIAEMYKGGNIHDLERIIAKYPESNPASVYCLRIGKMNEFKKDSKAEEYLRMAIKTDGVYRFNEQLYQVKPLAMLHLARYYAKTGKKDEALKLLTAIRDDFPSAVLEDGKSLIVKGVVFQSLSSEVGGK